MQTVVDSPTTFDYDYDYDDLGRVTKITQEIVGLTPIVELTSQYDAAGRRTQLAAKIGTADDFVTDYTYDNLGRVATISQEKQSGGNEVAKKYIDLAFDLLGQPEQIKRYADTDEDGQADELVAVTDYLFDNGGSLTDLTHHDGAQAPINIADYNLAYDVAGRIVDFDFTYDETDYDTNSITYDDTNQLTDVDYDNWETDEDYEYDENGNRVTNGFTVGSNNQLLTDATYTYAYDDEGNRTKRYVAASPNTDVTVYTWDHRNRMTKVTHYPTEGGAADKIYEYTYDHAARWIRKTRDTNADNTVDESRVFVYDGKQSTLQFDKTGDTALVAADLTHRYLWHTSTDHLLADE